LTIQYSLDSFQIDGVWIQCCPFFYFSRRPHLVLTFFLIFEKNLNWFMVLCQFSNQIFIMFWGIWGNLSWSLKKQWRDLEGFGAETKGFLQGFWAEETNLERFGEFLWRYLQEFFWAEAGEEETINHNNAQIYVAAGEFGG